MVKLSEFIGGLVSGVSEARKIADSNSVTLSQGYHADPFLKGMPVPHYTIEEAEIKVPVSIKGIVSGSKEKILIQSFILSAIKLKMPQLLNNQFLMYYVDKKKADKQKEDEKQQAAVSIENSDTSSDVQSLEESTVEVSEALRKRYAKSSNRIAKNIEEPMNTFLSTANFEIIKLLDIKDKFVELLKNEIRCEFSSYAPDSQPITEDKLDEFAQEIGTGMFFEFKHFSDDDRGIFVEPNTGKMNEYADKNNLVYMTIKIKEQDLDLVVEDTDGSSSQRFLSLN